MAVAGAAGVSGSSAHTVPRLLLGEEIGGFCLTELVDLREESREHIDGRPCVRLTGRYPEGLEQSIWLDARSLLLRRLSVTHVLEPMTEAEQAAMQEDMLKRMETMHRETAQILRQRGLPQIRDEPTRVESTTFYQPEINISIDLASFDFTPPVGPKPERPHRRWFPPQDPAV